MQPDMSPAPSTTLIQIDNVRRSRHFYFDVIIIVVIVAKWKTEKKRISGETAKYSKKERFLFILLNSLISVKRIELAIASSHISNQSHKHIRLTNQSINGYGAVNLSWYCINATKNELEFLFLLVCKSIVCVCAMRCNESTVATVHHTAQSNISTFIIDWIYLYTHGDTYYSTSNILCYFPPRRALLPMPSINRRSPEILSV